MNEDKTSFIMFSNVHRHPIADIRIGGFKVKQVDSAKYLGIIIDRELTFRAHFNYVMQKMSACFGVLHRLSQYTPSYVLKTVYLAIKYPYLVYGVEVWGGSGDPLLSKLRRLQDRCVRLCSDEPHLDVQKLYQVNRLLPYNEIYKYFTSIRLFHYYKLERNIFFKDTLTELRGTHDHLTRFCFKENLNTPKFRLSVCQGSFLYNAVHIWNAIPTAVRNSKTVHSFKAQLRRLYYSAKSN